MDPGDEVIVFAPFFGEYRQYAANFDSEIVTVNPDLETFLPDLNDFCLLYTSPGCRIHTHRFIPVKGGYELGRCRT